MYPPMREQKVKTKNKDKAEKQSRFDADEQRDRRTKIQTNNNAGVSHTQTTYFWFSNSKIAGRIICVVLSCRAPDQSVGTNYIRGVYSQEFVANEVKKSWSWSYKIIFLLILHIQIEELNYRLLTVLD